MAFYSVLKAALRRPLTSADLTSSMQAYVAHPPLPSDWYDFAVTMVGQKGVSLLEYWRRQFAIHLDEIAKQLTWEAQRSQLLQIVVERSYWLSLRAAVREAEYPDSWSHLVEDCVSFEKVSTSDGRLSMLVQLWLVATLSTSGLRDIGAKFYGVDKGKQLELDLYELLQRDTQGVDIYCMDLIHRCISEGDTSEAEAMAEFKDLRVNPILDDQFKTLHRMKDQIVNAELDTGQARAQLAALQERKEALGGELRDR